MSNNSQALAYSASQTAAKTAHMHSIYSCTFGILFFGTPHNGSSKAQLLGSLQKIVSLTVPKKILETDSSLLNALEEGSEILQNITDQFASLMPRFHVFFFWEQQRTSLPYSKAYIVDETSAAPILDGTERSGITADHRGICKFESRNSPGFRTVVAALRRYCREAPETIKARSARANIMLSEQRWHEATELVQDLPSHCDRVTATSPQHDQSTRQLALPHGKSRNGIPGNLGFASSTPEGHYFEDEKRSPHRSDSFSEGIRRPFQEQRA
jgi:protein SERAC1